MGRAKVVAPEGYLSLYDYSVHHGTSVSHLTNSVLRYGIEKNKQGNYIIKDLPLADLEVLAGYERPAHAPRKYTEDKCNECESASTHPHDLCLECLHRSSSTLAKRIGLKMLEDYP